MRKKRKTEWEIQITRKIFAQGGKKNTNPEHFGQELDKNGKTSAKKTRDK